MGNRNNTNRMKIFIAWSGKLSHRLAKALHRWLPQVLPYVEPWISSEDINKGMAWTPELWGALRNSDFGIICLVPGIEKQPWVLLEMGALACTQAKDRVAPFLVGLEPNALSEPLRQFQYVKAEREDVLRLLKRINDAAGEKSISEDAIDEAFRKHWSKLQKNLYRFAIECPVVKEEPKGSGGTNASHTRGRESFEPDY